MGCPPSANAPTNTQASLPGLAFEPLSLAQSVRELDRRGIAHGGLEPFELGGEQLWTNVMLSELNAGITETTLKDVLEALQHDFSILHRSFYVFVCEYADHDLVRVWAPPNRPVLAEELRSREGGPLGLLGLKEITLGAQDYSSAVAHWERVLAPAKSLGEAAWAIGEGPAIRLVPSAFTGMLSLTFDVGSIDQAREFLADRDMLGESSMEELTIAPSVVQGLDLRLTEASESG